MKAHEILNAAASHLMDRAKTYDQPEGERSMDATVKAFNAVTGHELTETQGWVFMALLKAVRSQQGAFKSDSYEDGAAYFALAGESAAKSAGMGNASDKAADGFAVETNVPDWKNAPEWAQWVAQDLDGSWHWYKTKPIALDEVWSYMENKFQPAADGPKNPNWRETLQARPSNDGWLEWHGGERPVNGKVQVKLRDGKVLDFNNAENADWHHNNDQGDIIAYRPLP